MKHFLAIIKSAFFDFSRNKGRTFLTSLGILIGVMSVVLLLALGLGLKKYISNQFDALGANLVYVMPGNENSAMSGTGFVGGIKFDDRDVQKIRRVAGIEVVAPAYAKPGAVMEANGKSETGELIASTDDINQVMNLQLEMGRLIEARDNNKRIKTIVISPKIAAKLFGSEEEALGKKITIEDQNFTVMGIYKSKGGGGLGGSDMDSHVFIPNEAGFVFNTEKKYLAVYAKARSKDLIGQVKTDIKSTLLKRYKEKQFSVLDQTEIMGTIDQIFSVLNLVLVAIAAISLVVGGIGIMNIMYVTVTERIKEIGVRRALGARKNDILLQFLAESVALSLLGGLMGLALSYLIVMGVQKLFPAYIDTNSVLLAIGVSTVIGVVFGVFPAKKAADLSPIDAIRYE